MLEMANMTTTFRRTLPILIVLGITGVLFLDQVSGAMLSFLFFPLTADGSADSDSDSDSDSGDSDSGDCCGCECGSSSTDCGPGDCGCGSGGGTQPSSPFLCVWNGSRFEFENDLLVGPASFYRTYEEGMQQYRPIEQDRDMYLLDKLTADKDGTIALQIKEIEPEESFIDSLSLKRLTYAAHEKLLPRPDHRGFYVFNKDEFLTQRGIKEINVHITGRENDWINTDPIKSGPERTLDDNESIDINAQITLTDKPPVLLISSRYRDWVAGEIPMIEGTATKRFTILSPWVIVRKSILFSVAILLWFFGHGAVDSDKSDSISTLAQGFGLRAAHADAPGGGGSKSLIIEYYSPATERYARITTVHPRYAKAQVEAIPLPEEAVGANNIATLRITATKRHAVDMISLFVPSSVNTQESLTTEELQLSHAYLERTNEESKDTLRDTTSVFVHTVPGDTLNISFKSTPPDNVDGVQHAYLLTVDGFYTNLSYAGKELAGNDWVAKLDPQARNQLSNMYTLGDYRRANRQPFLT